MGTMKDLSLQAAEKAAPRLSAIMMEVELALQTSANPEPKEVLIRTIDRIETLIAEMYVDGYSAGFARARGE